MRKLLLWSSIFCFTSTNLLAQQRPVWPAVKKEMHPWTRWWWMGNAVDEKNLDQLLTAYHTAGIGGVEITPIYGAKGYENRYVQFLSPQWLRLLDFTVNKATSLDMGVDMNTGTGWPFGGPQITKELGAEKLVVNQYTAHGGERFSNRLEVEDTAQSGSGAVLRAVTAVSDRGERISLSGRTDNDQQLDWLPPPGLWTVYAAFSVKTGQRVKRAAPGGEGYVMDHYSKAAVGAYLKRFSDSLTSKPRGIDAFFNDSYEVSWANWCPEFFDAFKQIKGYDLRLYIKELQEQQTDTVARIKSDYNEVLGKLLLHDFTETWTAWAHANGAKARNQAHGSPGNLLDLYSASDIPECESFFGITPFPIPGLPYDTADVREKTEHNPVVFKFASSAAHFYGKPLASSETFVWQTEHFRTTLSRCKPEVEQLFLAGINHVFFHGTTYSPQDASWPGWTFYATTNFAPANSIWPHLKGMTDYITRCQSVLQAGKADNQLLIYWPVYDQWNDPKGMEKRFSMHGVEEWLYPTAFNKLAKSLRHAGYSTDYVSDKMIEDALQGRSATSATVLVIPACRYMPVQTLDNILQLAKQGWTVIFQQLPSDVPGFADLDGSRKKFRELLAGISFSSGGPLEQVKTGAGRLMLSPFVPDALDASDIQREKLTDFGLEYVRRNLDDGKYYYIVNHGAKAVDAYVSLNVMAGQALIMDPQNGSYGLASVLTSQKNIKLRLQMQPGEALIVRTYNAAAPGWPAWKYIVPRTTMTIGGQWSLHFTAGGPTLPRDKKLSALQSWTELGDSQAIAFSGSAVYTNSFMMPSLQKGEYMLQLGEVHESAHVWINGKDAGIVWSFPFRERIGQFLKPGLNTIRIEVANLMANRISYMDRNGLQWRNYHEINFVNIQYKPFDASMWPALPSGLLGPVTITAMRADNNNPPDKKKWLNGWNVEPHGSINREELAIQYRLHKTLWDKAFLFLKQSRLDTLRPGRYPIVGDSVFATVSEGPVKRFEASEWESHRQYFDIYHEIKGKEIIGITSFGTLTVREPYDVKRDVTFWNDRGMGNYYTSTPAEFFIFFSDDAHRPSILAEGYNPVKKVVVKIRSDSYP